MASYFLIGGHDWSILNPSYIDKMIGLTKKSCPNILIIPLAMKDKESTILNHLSLYKNKNVHLEVLYLTKEDNISKIESILNQMDILYFTGGKTIYLKEELIKKGILKVLLKLKNKDIIFAGDSAGAILFSKAGMIDSLSYQSGLKSYGYQMYDALNFIPIAFCPHYDNENLICFNDYVSDYDISIACENDCAVYIKNNVIIPFKANPKKSVYLFKREEGFRMSPIYEWKKLSVLGPKGTFSETAGLKFLEYMGLDLPLEYSNSIRKAGKKIQECGIGVLPLENTLDGYVQETIDLMNEYDYHILFDLNVKVEFAFIANTTDLDKIKNVYVQYKAKGQCLDFLESHKFNIIETESNMTSYNNLINSNEFSGAIVPLMAIDRDFPTIIKNVEDSKNNYTRFVVLTNENLKMAPPKEYKTSLILTAKNDKPGILYNMLAMFSIFDINLNAIMSRPTKTTLGSYYFYIEFSNKKENYLSIKEVISLIERKASFNVKFLGMYDNITKEDF